MIKDDILLENGELRVPLAESLQNTRTILATARQLFPTIMVGPPTLLEDELNQRLAFLSQQFALICETLEIPYLEVFGSLQHNQTWKEEIASNDGAHPRATGYTLLVHLVQRWSCWQSWFA